VLAIGAIFVFLLAEVAPLFAPPRAEPRPAPGLVPGRGAVLAVAVDPYLERILTVRRSGIFEVYPGKDSEGESVFERSLFENRRSVTAAAYDPRRAELVAASEDGQLAFWRVAFVSSFAADRPRVEVEARPLGNLSIAPGEPIERLAFAAPSEGARVVAFLSRYNRLRVLREERRTTLLGETRSERQDFDLSADLSGPVTALVITSDGRRLYAGTAEGRLHRWNLSSSGPAVHEESVAAAPAGTAITSLGVLIGDRSLVVGDAAGRVSIWFAVRDPSEPSGWASRRVRELAPHRSPVLLVSPSLRRKSFLTVDEAGEVWLRHSTSGRTLLRLEAARGIPTAAFFAPKEDAAVRADGEGRLSFWTIEAPHPEVSLRTLFGRVWYEGYERPEFVWQSTGGTDDFEPKFSLTPLAFGTLKGTAYAMFFAVPLAVLAALYTSQFLRPQARGLVKPTIELMAALPSVVLGFVAGLWLAPRVAKIVPGIFLALFVVPATLLVAAAIWRKVPQVWRSRVPEGLEILLLLPLAAAALGIALWLGEALENGWFGGDFPHWLAQVAGIRYEQRNALVVGLAMGFAVIPIVYTISEDALSGVPQRLVSASAALGATPWQTATRVVLPTASPGIFAATMIGFGRAVGETMIVLMATGNTPILDPWIFTGFRALSANIAVEIPEAPVGGTLYRVLFLAALLLFVTTFCANTLAEVVRMRLRERYARL
jgi:phosphate transport system permease protein